MYPAAHRAETADVLHGRVIPDPYRWLEDATDPRTAAWSAAQAELFAKHQATWHARDRFKARLTQLTAVGMVSVPRWAGGRRFHLRREPGQEHAVLYADDRPLVDPNALDPTGATTLDHWYPSHEGNRLAYAISVGGSEEPRLHVLDLDTGELIDGPIDRMRDPSVAWLPGGQAFYYTRFLESTQDGQPWLHRRVYLHTVGAGAEDDRLIWGEGAPKGRYFASHVSDDGRWLTLFERQGTDPRRDIWIADLTRCDPAAPGFAPLQVGVDALTFPIPLGDNIYLFTDRDAPRGRICVAPAADPSYENWRELIAADADSVLSDLAVLDGAIAVAATRHAIGELSLHDSQTGRRLADVPLPGLGTVSGLTANPADRSAAWLSYTDFSTVRIVLRLDRHTHTLSEDARPPGGTPIAGLDTRQVTYRSKDGTPVRMFVVSKPGADGDGPKPTILYGYGGFNISLTPEYRERLIAWVEAGGVYAIANLRGGSEEGEQWHRAGMNGSKQNVFDDFHAAGDWLVDNGVTTRDRLAIVGGSNGGLLVGAAVTQRPDAYAAVVCSAPLLDMVRYELFGLGMTWSGEYGTAADPEHLQWLLAYSPYHNVREGVTYPPVLLVAFEGDSRVDPLHARKMAAALQHAARFAGGPILLRAEAHVGHGSRAVSRMVDLAADELGFLAAALSPVVDGPVDEPIHG